VEKAITGKVKLEDAVHQGFDALAAPDSAHLKILVQAPVGRLITSSNKISNQ
jgi:copper homeostasis protein CutC